MVAYILCVSSVFSGFTNAVPMSHNTIKFNSNFNNLLATAKHGSRNRSKSDKTSM